MSAREVDETVMDDVLSVKEIGHAFSGAFAVRVWAYFDFESNCLWVAFFGWRGIVRHSAMN